LRTEIRSERFRDTVVCPQSGGSGQVPLRDEIFPATAPLTYKEAGFYKHSLTFTDETVEDLASREESAKTQAASAGMLPWLSIGDGIAGWQLMSSRRAGGDRGAPQPEFNETAGR